MRAKVGTLGAVADGGSNEQSPICTLSIRTNGSSLTFYLIRLTSLKVNIPQD